MTNGSHKVPLTKKKPAKRKPTPVRTTTRKIVPKSLRVPAR